MKHQHIYDKDGKQLCCTLEEKINQKAEEHHDHDHDDDHDHASTKDQSNVKLFLFISAAPPIYIRSYTCRDFKIFVSISLLFSNNKQA